MAIKIFLLLFSWFLLLTNSASAHILEKDIDVGAVMHIDPDDDPILHEPSIIYLDFSDQSGDFQLKDCLCKVEIRRSGTLLFTQSLYAGQFGDDTQSTAFSFTFLEPSVYQIIVQGTSTNNAEFSPFTLKYDIRVDRVREGAVAGNSARGSGSQNIITASIAILILVGIILYINTFKKRDRT